VMELVDGPSVTDVVICQKKLSEAWAVHILRQAVIGLEFLHENKVIHRDFKVLFIFNYKSALVNLICALQQPDNMLVDSSLKLKLIDFGTATKIENDEFMKRRSTVGTPWYCAPEVRDR